MKTLPYITLLSLLIITACSDESEDKQAALNKKQFINECLTTDAPKSICYCAYDELEKEYGIKDLIKISSLPKSPPEFSFSLLKAFYACK
jgi:hypothetical protein